nr:hypothetical protein [Tanacetum cinerariifolium]
PKRQRFYGFASNRTSPKDVYSRKRIITVTSLKIMKWYDYGHLDEIEVRREDQQLYKFKEVDFPRLRLRDIRTYNDNDDDQSINIEETDDDELTESDNEDQEMDDAEKNDEDKVEEEKDIDQELALYEQAKDYQVGVLASKTHKEKPILFVFISSHSVSSNYGNKFLISSPERSLMGTVKESVNAKITSMVDVQIQQKMLYVPLAPLHDVLASVVPPTPTMPTPLPILTITTITTTVAPTSTFVDPESKTLSALQLRVSDLEKEVKELKQVNHSTTLRA